MNCWGRILLPKSTWAQIRRTVDSETNQGWASLDIIVCKMVLGSERKGKSMWHLRNYYRNAAYLNGHAGGIKSPFGKSLKLELCMTLHHSLIWTHHGGYHCKPFFSIPLTYTPYLPVHRLWTSPTGTARGRHQLFSRLAQILTAQTSQSDWNCRWVRSLHFQMLQE